MTNGLDGSTGFRGMELTDDCRDVIPGTCSSPNHFVGQNSPILLDIVCAFPPCRRCPAVSARCGPSCLHFMLLRTLSINLHPLFGNSGTDTRITATPNREGPAMFKHDGTYYLWCTANKSYPTGISFNRGPSDGSVPTSPPQPPLSSKVPAIVSGLSGRQQATNFIYADVHDSDDS